MINARRTALALAVSALMASPLAMAQDNGEHDVTVTKTFDVDSDIDRDTDIDIDSDSDVDIDKDLSLDSDIEISGEPQVVGTITVDSAAIAIVDNHQSVSENVAENDLLTNSAAISGDVASDAEGNLGFNVAAGDNNVQDNAAALSAADASFAFGMADAEVFVDQSGSFNWTQNTGVINRAGVSGNAFNAASGNIGVNVASGNNNQQKNALAASVATTSYAQASITSNQHSFDNEVSNSGHYERVTETIAVSMRGPVEGGTVAVGSGGYSGSESGSYSGTGNAYQANDFYPDTWNGNRHTDGSQTGHIDFDSEAQGAVANPYSPGNGGLAFDTDESGTYRGTEGGDLGFVEFGYADLYANLSGSIVNSYLIAVNATNTASLSGSAFSAASGNIGVNVASGTGNMQANSLAMAVAQPSTGGGEEPPPPPPGE